VSALPESETGQVSPAVVSRTHWVIPVMRTPRVRPPQGKNDHQMQSDSHSVDQPLSRVALWAGSRRAGLQASRWLGGVGRAPNLYAGFQTTGPR
jgi:hypothetical protein